MFFKKIIQKLLNTFGYRITKIPISNDKILEKNLFEYPIFFDVGANKGQSISRFRKISLNSVIHSFEPIEKNYKFLKENFKKNVIINNIALGEKNEKKKFYIYKKDTNSSFFKSNLFPIIGKKIIQSITLDSYIKKNKINHIDLLKIDTQGYEESILKGAKNSLDNININFIEVEIILGNTYEHYSTIYKVEKYLNNNYRLVNINLFDNSIFEKNSTFGGDFLYCNKKIFKKIFLN